MSEHDLKRVADAVEELQRRTRSIESAVHALLGIVALAAVVASVVIWGVAPLVTACGLGAFAIALGTWAGRRAQASAQIHLDLMASSARPDAGGRGGGIGDTRK